MTELPDAPTRRINPQGRDTHGRSGHPVRVGGLEAEGGGLELPRIPRRFTTLASILITTAGVGVLAYRCDTAELDDGAVSGVAVLVMGLVLFVAPFAAVVHSAAGTDSTVLPVAIVSLGSSISVASLKPGNLVGVAFPVVAVIACTLVLLSEGLVGLIARKQDRD
ncbi:MAG: hypothetical protein ACRDZZ_08710 [Ilumatobacteraceae bacterium]